MKFRYLTALVTAAAIALALTSGAIAQTSTSTTMTATTKPVTSTTTTADMAPASVAPTSKASENFVKSAAIGGMFEEQTSQLALQKSQNAVVKEFAQRMISDHTAADNKLKTVLTAAKVNAATLPKELDSDHQTTLAELKRAANGAAFDKQYLAAQTNAHSEAVSLFEGYAKNGDNPVLQQFASDTLPTLKDHAKELADIKASKK